MSKRQQATFYVYDMKDNERLAHICDSLDELCIYFNRSKNSVKSAITRNQLFEWKYLIVREYCE